MSRPSLIQPTFSRHALSGRFHSLDPSEIIRTAEALHRVVADQFPDANLKNVAEEMVAFTHRTISLASALARPILWIRASTSVCILLLLVLFVTPLYYLQAGVALFSSIADLMQGLDATVNEIVFLGIAIFFLLSIETRVKRRRAFESLHVLRSMSHIIDMHQLAKDPDLLSRAAREESTPEARQKSAYELTRYLDSCSEMLAVMSKLAALHVQEFNDPITLSAVNDIEELTQGFSRKIWQKIMILDRILSPQ